MTTTEIITRATARGSSARTVQGALRYLRAHLPRARRFALWGLPRYGGPRPADPARAAAVRAAWYAADHARRAAARYEPLAQEWLVALGLRPLDPARERARVRAAQRSAEVAEALASDEERDLLAAGYTLTRDGTHRVLAGVDDGHAFQTRVPLRCRTIAEALEWLRPDDVPGDAPRQGEWFFVPCDAPPPPVTAGWEITSVTEAGSEVETRVTAVTTFDTRGRHLPEECVMVERRGSTVFVGRRALKSHDWTARPRLFARGVVRHDEHGELDLGGRWHEVVPNRAHGPFAVGSSGGGID